MPARRAIGSHLIETSAVLAISGLEASTRPHLSIRSQAGKHAARRPKHLIKTCGTAATDTKLCAFCYAPPSLIRTILSTLCSFVSMDSKELNARAMRARIQHRITSLVSQYESILEEAAVRSLTLSMYFQLLTRTNLQPTAEEQNPRSTTIVVAAATFREQKINMLSQQMVPLLFRVSRSVLMLIATKIRAAEDLLTLSHQMQELWLYGKLDTVGKSKVQVQANEDAEKVAQLLDTLFQQQIGGNNETKTDDSTE